LLTRSVDGSAGGDYLRNLASGALGASARGRRQTTVMDGDQLVDFARRYTAAWCSGKPEQVADHYSPTGSLAINDGEPAIGRAAITDAAQSFMRAFPDLQVVMDDLHTDDRQIEYHWTLIGTNTGPGGTGNAVRISGFEEWTIGQDELITKSLGHYDQAEYDRQIAHGADQE
jgi:hypothetical protein